MIAEKFGDAAFSSSLKCQAVPRQSIQHINRHIIRIASRHRAILGPLSSLAGCQPRALEVAGSNPAGPISILEYIYKKILLRLAPLIHECHANFECRLYDDALEDKYNFFVFEVVKSACRCICEASADNTLQYTTQAMVCSWSQARSSAESHCFGRGCCELIFEAFYDHILDEKTQLLQFT